MASFLITGCSRGLGLELVRLLLSESPERVSLVFAATRGSSPSPQLESLIAESGGRARHVSMDIASSESIDAAVPVITQHLGGGKGLDYLINNAAVRDATPTALMQDLQNNLGDVLQTNVVGTHRVISSLLTLFQRNPSRKTIINISSALGSLNLAQTDAALVSVPLPAYKISKAGLHMLTTLWSNQLRPHGFCVYLQSPGSLQTEAAGGLRADLPVEVGAREILRIAFEATPADSGRHRNILVEEWKGGGGKGGRYDGLDLPW